MKRPRGFSLLEILVAFTILAMALGVAMQIFSGSLRNADIARDQAQAAALAQSLLAGVGIEAPLEVGEATGSLANRFHWQLSVAPHDEGPRPGTPDGMRPMMPPVELWRITANVSWGGDGGAPRRDLTLSTLRIRSTVNQ